MNATVAPSENRDLGAPKGDTAPVTPRISGRMCLAGVTVLALVLNCWGLSKNGLANTYYAAAVRSMTESWSNFFFASFDPGGYISVDKPPVALWVEALSARVFGYNSWSLLLPSALAGAGSVALLWLTVRRRFGVAAATVAGLVLALSPINVAVNRLNLPEPFLILLLTGAAYAVVRSFDARRSVPWLVLAGALVGLAFNVKMLQAYIALPALAVAVAVAALPRWRLAVRNLLVLGTSTVAASVPWMIGVWLVSPASRPYVGGSTDDSVWDLVIGYNGLGRISGEGQGAPGGGPGGGFGGAGGGFGGAGGVFGGSPGWFRMFNEAVGSQIAWLIPLAAGGAVAAWWLHRRDGHTRASLALWSVWVAAHGLVFSFAEGIFHSYYTSQLAPGIAAFVGIGGVALWRLARTDRRWLALAAASLAATIVVQLELAGRTPDFYAWVGTPLVAGSVAGVVLALLVKKHRRLATTGACVALSAVLLAPAVWATSETSNPTLNATLPQAGPRQGTAGQTFGSATGSNSQLAAFLRAQRDGERWDLVTSSAMDAAGYIAYDRLSVMALGGFLGSDPAIDLESFAALVAAGAVRFVLVGGGPGGAGGGVPGGDGVPGGANGDAGPAPRQPPGNIPLPPGANPPGNSPIPPGANPPGGGPASTGGRTQVQAVFSAAQAACSPVDTAAAGLPSTYSGRLYDCAGAADALRAATAAAT